MSDPFVSIIVPTYNRWPLVGRAIESALAWRGEDSGIEIIVVDDGSTDGTLDSVASIYFSHVDAGYLRLISMSANGGAVAARNLAAKASRGKWLLLLDSDDLLVEKTRTSVLQVLRDACERPLVFFRCKRLEDDSLIGDRLECPTEVTVTSYLSDWRWGECIPAIRREAFAAFPYDSDLRGHEGLAYARMFKHLGPGIIHPLVVRSYDDGGDDRLSTRAARFQRADLLTRGYARTLKEFYRDLRPLAFMRTASRVCVYAVAAVIARMSNGRPTSAP